MSPSRDSESLRAIDQPFALIDTKIMSNVLITYSYPASKLLNILATRGLIQKIGPNTDVAINLLSPGFCHSALTRNSTGSRADQLAQMKEKYARTTEEGSRTLVHAVAIGKESNGHYLDDCAIDE